MRRNRIDYFVSNPAAGDTKNGAKFSGADDFHEIVEELGFVLVQYDFVYCLQYV